MNSNTQEQSFAKIVGIVSPKFHLIEIVAFSAFFIGLIIKEFTEFDAGLIILMALQVLSIIYFLNAFAPINDEHAGLLEVLLHKILNIGLSIATIGILFRLMHWPLGGIFFFIHWCDYFCGVDSGTFCFECEKTTAKSV